ncbi:unnamed protein product [Miscanthus lutarioriparius]|uniref:tRNA/rRNA methyltransferase SpoU type domain-containing protein n=1 Tax=Miscanthus lutarioriparius TaxID=422564 RepID=A0A811RTX0_9POAL|nr:unnamed protein product [Miscanthus lutarioriparius]
MAAAVESVVVVHNVGTLPRSATAFGVAEDERGRDICGVEITDDAKPVTAHPFRRSTAFLFGNEGTGLSQKECDICDFFVYIPQYGGGTASLNVTVAASIVLHHFGGKSFHPAPVVTTSSLSGLAFLNEAERAINSLWLIDHRGTQGAFIAQTQLKQ